MLTKLQFKTIESDTKGLYYSLLSTTSTQKEFNIIDIGLMNGEGKTYSITKKSIVFIDVTDLYNNGTTFDKLCSLVTDYCDYVFVKEEDNSPIIADEAKYAETSGIADYIVGQINGILVNSEYVYGDDETNGWFYRLSDLAIEPDHKYLCCVAMENESDFDLANGMGIIDTSGVWESGKLVPFTLINHEYQGYSIVITSDISKTIAVQFIYNTTHISWIKVKIYDVTDYDDISLNDILRLLNQKDKYTAEDIINMIPIIEEEDQNNIVDSDWNGKNVLVIGDSLTAAMKWQTILNSYLGMNVYTHAKGGMGIIQCVDGENGAGEYDNETAASGTLYALNVDDVKDMDLIIFFAGYNNRGTSDGEVGDCYNPSDNSGKIGRAHV